VVVAAVVGRVVNGVVSRVVPVGVGAVVVTSTSETIFSFLYICYDTCRGESNMT